MQEVTTFQFKNSRQRLIEEKSVCIARSSIVLFVAAFIDVVIINSGSVLNRFFRFIMYVCVHAAAASPLHSTTNNKRFSGICEIAKNSWFLCCFLFSSAFFPFSETLRLISIVLFLSLAISFSLTQLAQIFYLRHLLAFHFSRDTSCWYTFSSHEAVNRGNWFKHELVRDDFLFQITPIVCENNSQMIISVQEVDKMCVVCAPLELRSLLNIFHHPRFSFAVHVRGAAFFLFALTKVICNFTFISSLASILLTPYMCSVFV